MFSNLRINFYFKGGCTMLLLDKILFLFNKEDIYIGYSIDEVAKITSILKENNINYKHKVVKLLRSDERFSLKRVGVNMNYETQYTVSVKESDYEEAKYLVNKVLHPNNFDDRKDKL
jgi:hypothetical protein